MNPVICFRVLPASENPAGRHRYNNSSTVSLNGSLAFQHAATIRGGG